MTGYESEWAAEDVAYTETQAYEDAVHESYTVTAPCVRCGQLIFLSHDPYVASGGTPTQYEHERCGEDAYVELGR